MRRVVDEGLIKAASQGSKPRSEVRTSLCRRLQRLGSGASSNSGVGSKQHDCMLDAVAGHRRRYFGHDVVPWTRCIAISVASSWLIDAKTAPPLSPDPVCGRGQLRNCCWHCSSSTAVALGEASTGAERGLVPPSQAWKRGCKVRAPVRLISPFSVGVTSVICGAWCWMPIG
jgi:hypothetical protein